MNPAIPGRITIGIVSKHVRLKVSDTHVVTTPMMHGYAVPTISGGHAMQYIKITLFRGRIWSRAERKPGFRARKGVIPRIRPLARRTLHCVVSRQRTSLVRRKSLPPLQALRRCEFWALSKLGGEEAPRSQKVALTRNWQRLLPQ